MIHDLDAIRARAKEFREKLALYPDVEAFFGSTVGEQTETEFLLAEIDRLNVKVERLRGSTDHADREAALIARLGEPEPDARFPREVAPGAHASTAKGYHRYGCRAQGCV